uniref:Phytanoyl-CoA dioxygenase n=1 Tax=Attheya septentrionalis TaxID=420275 RepID=A0A7S2XL36_9STRA|mmetsp:Transcript_17968/g.32571  ORF Transcript_17968/g.32571 Transcript_17968/m.32571 type:complete len:377 (+) Transcript_17968:101-1231(+)
MMALTKEQVETFRRDGVLVVDNILDPDEVRGALDGLSETLGRYGVDTNNLSETAHHLANLSSTNGSGGVLDLFYPPWKCKVATNANLFHVTSQLWEASFCHDGESQESITGEEIDKWHPFGPFDPLRGFMYMDRIGYRLPTVLSQEIGQQLEDPNKKKSRSRPLQRSLTPHLDCCPETLYSLENKSKWRPIQCFVSLTDNVEPNTGGFEAVPGFHRKFDEWARHRPPTTMTKKIKPGERVSVSYPAACVGEYTHIRPKEDCSIMERVQHIPVKAGSAVFWDNRIPHANAYRNDGQDARAVVYCSFLPVVPLNQIFVERQLEDWKSRRKPRDQWIEIQDDSSGVEGTPPEANILCKDIEEQHEFSDLGRKLMGIDRW